MNPRQARVDGARCVHGSMFLERSPSFCPVQQLPQNHTPGPNFCTLQPLLAYQEFLFFVMILVTGPRVLISAPCGSCWYTRNSDFHDFQFDTCIASLANMPCWQNCFTLKFGKGKFHKGCNLWPPYLIV